MSNQIQQRNGAKNIVAKRDNNSRAKVNNLKGKLWSTKKKSSRPALLNCSTTLSTGLDKATKKPAKKIDWLPEPEEPWNEALSSTAPWNNARNLMNVVLPPTSNWPLPPCPAMVSFSRSGVTINQRAGNLAHFNFLNTGNKRSAHRYHHNSG